MKNTKKKIAQADQQEISRLAEQLKTEVQSLEETHPALVQAVNALCLMLSRLGI